MGIRSALNAISLALNYQFNNSLVKLIFSITNACNSRCSMCNVWKVYLENPGMISNELSTEEAKLVVRRSKAKWLSLTGGEPTLRRDLPELVEEAERSGYLLVDFSTNGLNPDRLEEILREVASSTRRISIHVGVSVDGPPGVHEAQRGVPTAWRSGVETLKVLMNSKELFDGRLSYGIIVTPTELNADNVGEIIPALESEGIVVENLALSPPSGGVQYHADHDHRWVWRNIMPKVRETLTVSGYGRFRTITRRLLFALGELYAEEGGLVIPCTALRNSAYVDPYGDVYPCPILSKRIGNVRDSDYDVRRLLRTERAEEVREFISTGACACMTSCLFYERIVRHPLRTLLAYARWRVGRLGR